MTGDPEVVYPPPVGAPYVPPPAAPESDGLGPVSPQQVLLTTGAVALTAAGAASLAAVGRPLGQLLLAALALGTAAASWAAGRRGLRSSEETLAAAAVVLAVVGAWSAGSSPGSRAVLLGGLAGVLLLAGLLARTASAWPIGSWLAAQLAVLAVLTGQGWRTDLVLGTALAGLLVARVARRPVAEVSLATTAPWWLAGVAVGAVQVWTTSAPGTAALLVAVAAALALVRSRRALRAVLGPRPLVPVVAGVVAGVGIAGALQGSGAAGTPAAGYLGLAVAVLVAAGADPRPEGLARPVGLALASTCTGLSAGQLLLEGRWTALGLLLMAAAVPAVLVAARQPADRPGALPIAVGCLAAAALFLEADGAAAPGRTGVELLVLAVVALGAATLERHSRSERPLAVSAVVVGVLAVVHLGWSGDLLAAAAGLAVLGAALTAYAVRTDRTPARAGGCAALAGAAWLAAGDAGAHLAEAYTLPAAAALLLYAGRALATERSWPAWGPALVTAFGPSVTLAVFDEGLLRLVLVVAAAGLVMTLASGPGVRAPFVVGAVSVVTVALGRLAVALPLPGLLAVLVVGVVLLVVGARYETRRRKTAPRVADMR
ncbi:SCO7613 C-terminal domain-containing membrane protein [Modestobacter sp. SSW1-42]|uniref:SCO7613 C-terminal domain-containing membrane protein n=1 Tax=Modestobacter sp. SSW1-42 TaxID=596372 RepID=UPI0039869223